MKNVILFLPRVVILAALFIVFLLFASLEMILAMALFILEKGASLTEKFLHKLWRKLHI